jgi:hypothetical protein
LVKHLFTADATKRYECLKNGIKDIIEHRWIKGFDWRGLLFMNLEPFYIPKVKVCIIYIEMLLIPLTSQYPDSDSEVLALKPDKDLFLQWDK